MDEVNVFMDFYQNKVNAYNFTLRQDNSHIPVNYVKLVLARYGVDVIYFIRYENGRMHYWCHLVNGNQVEIRIVLDHFGACDSEYATYDFDILERYAFVIEHENEKGNSFLFDDAEKGVEGILIGNGSAKKYIVI